MRYVKMAVLVGLLVGLTVNPASAWAIGNAQAAETVLIDQKLIMYPGAAWTECVDVGKSVLTVQASSPPGRTGETVNLLFMPNRQTVRPEVYLAVPLQLDSVTASHTVEAGTYCYHVMVTGQEPPGSDPNRPDRPNKQVRIKVTQEPSS